MEPRDLSAAVSMRRSEEASLAGSVALVTGASSGVGRAIAVSLAHYGAFVCAAGRNRKRLGETIAQTEPGTLAIPFQADLTLDASINQVDELLRKEFARLDILVHSSGSIQHSPMASAHLEDLDRQYTADVRAPYALTKALLPMLKASRGQIIFINSSLGLTAQRPEVGQFAATQHAMKAIADSLRQEVNADGIRVMSLFLGRTATPRQERLYREEGRVYQPELLMQPEDVAEVVVCALALPRTAEITDVSMRPLTKSY